MKNIQKGSAAVWVIGVVVLIFILGGLIHYSGYYNLFYANDFKQGKNSVEETYKVPADRIPEYTNKNISPTPVSQTNTGSCKSVVSSRESSSSEYSALSSLVSKGWVFDKAIISDFNCDGDEDVIVASHYSGSPNFFKIGLEYFQKNNDSWKLISQTDALAAPFSIHYVKTSEGGNAVAITLKGYTSIVVGINDGQFTGI